MASRYNKERRVTESNLNRTLLLNLILISITSILVLGAVWIYSEYNGYQKSSRQMKERMVNEHKARLKLEVENSVGYLKYMMAQTEQRLRQSVKARVYEAHAVATHLYRRHRNQMPTAQLKDLIREALRPIRYNAGRGYYFATDLNGVEQLFADRPELEGVNMLELRGGRGEYVVKDMIAIARQMGEGFYTYHWTKPSADGNDHPKVAFIKYFEPFDWFIGTGEYLGDVTADIQKEVLARFERVKIGKDGYIFSGTWQGLGLSGPLRGENTIDITDINGVKIVREMISLAKDSGGYLTYVMPPIADQRPLTKISYIAGIPEWEWYIGSGLYIDDIDATVAADREQMWAQIKNHIIKIVIIQAGLILLSLFLFFNMSHLTRGEFEAFSSAFAQAVESSEPINEQQLRWGEFKRLARSANTMISAREKAKQSLVENEAKYRRLFEQTNDAVFVVEKTSGRYLDANDAAVNLIGYSLDQLLNMTARETIPADLWKRVRKLIKNDRAMEIGDLVYDHPDGSRRIIDLTTVPLDADAVYAIARDITERKRIEEEVRLSEKRHRELANSLPQTVFEMDNTGRLTFVNKIAFKIFGYTRQDFDRGLNATDMLVPEDRDRAFENMGNVISGEKTRPEEYLAQSKDGSIFPVTIHANQIVIDGCVAGLRGIVVDLSEQKALESRLHQAQKMESIGTLAGGIAHDFNNILSAVIGYTELGLTDAVVKGQNVERYLTNVLKAATRAKSLVNQILTFARCMDEELKPVNVSIVAKEVLKLLRSSIPTTIKIRRNITSDALVMADVTQLHQIFMNLCTNAAHAMEEDGGTMEISITDCDHTEPGEERSHELKAGKYLKIEVRDSGRGIDPKNLPMIFEPYFTTKPIGEGTGLGLSVVHGIVESYGGTILVESELGRGTLFTIYLPVIEQVEEAPAKVVEALPTGSERILLVDDEKAVAEVGRRILERLGYHVTTKIDSVDALSFFKDHFQDFDLVISDMTMPDLSGDKLAAEVLKVRPDIPIILCTGYSKKLSQENISLPGIKALAMKPLTQKYLAETVRSVLDS